MKRYLLIIIACLVASNSNGQNIYTMKFLPQLAQSQWTNATNETDNKISIGLPVISATSVYLFNSGFTYHDMFKRVNDSTMAIHPGQFINGLKDKNFVAFGMSTSLLSFNLAMPDYSVGFSINDRADFKFSYPKALFGLLWFGNGKYIGQTINVGNFGINASWYREYALHGNFHYKDWTFGVSPKLLFGKANINTRESYLTLYTAPDYYELTANAGLNIQTSGIHDSTEEDKMSGSQYFFNNKNVGLAIDLGAKYKINDHFTVAGGINDIGYINWKTAIYNYTAGPAGVTFSGFNLADYLNGDVNFVTANKLTDSIKNLIQFKNNITAYKTSLPYNVYGIVYYETGKHLFGLQLSAERFNQAYLYAATASYQIKLNKHFTGDLTYTLRSRSPFNIGGALICQLAAMQLYFVTDNWWAPLVPLDSKNVNLQFGMNLVFGKRVKDEKKWY